MTERVARQSVIFPAGICGCIKTFFDGLDQDIMRNEASLRNGQTEDIEMNIDSISVELRVSNKGDSKVKAFADVTIPLGNEGTVTLLGPTSAMRYSSLARISVSLSLIARIASFFTKKAR